MYELNVEKYPWLITKYDDEWIEDEGHVELANLPDGWLISFGELLCEDLDNVIKRDNLTHFRIEEAKEKFGAVRIYSSGGNDETERIIDDYSVLSGNICIRCGKPDVHMTGAGWYYPCCEDCWDSSIPYDKAIADDDNKMATSHTIRGFSEGDHEDIVYDLTELAERIRNHWKEIKLRDGISDMLHTVEELFEEGEKRDKYIQDVEELKQKWIKENGLE